MADPEFDGSDIEGLDEPVAAEPTAPAEPAPTAATPSQEAAPEAPAKPDATGSEMLTIDGVTQSREKWESDYKTQKEQNAYFQKLHRDDLEALRTLQQQQPTAGQPQQSPQGPSIEQIESAYAPVVADVAKGAWGPEMAEFAEAWPKPLAQVMFQLDGLKNRLTNVERFRDDGLRRQYDTTASTVVQTFEKTVADLAGDDVFKALADPKVAQEFTKVFLDTVGDLPVTRMTPEFITNQAAAFLFPALRDRLGGTNKPTTSVRRRAAGEGTGARPSAQTEDELQKQFRELEEA